MKNFLDKALSFVCYVAFLAVGFYYMVSAFTDDGRIMVLPQVHMLPSSMETVEVGLHNYQDVPLSSLDESVYIIVDDANVPAESPVLVGVLGEQVTEAMKDRPRMTAAFYLPAEAYDADGVLAKRWTWEGAELYGNTLRVGNQYFWLLDLPDRFSLEVELWAGHYDTPAKGAVVEFEYRATSGADVTLSRFVTGTVFRITKLGLSTRAAMIILACICGIITLCLGGLLKKFLGWRVAREFGITELKSTL